MTCNTPFVAMMSGLMTSLSPTLSLCPALVTTSGPPPRLTRGSRGQVYPPPGEARDQVAHHKVLVSISDELVTRSKDREEIRS